MSLPTVDYHFVPGRDMGKKGSDKKDGLNDPMKKNPGILVVGGAHRFIKHKQTKEWDVLHFRCARRLAKQFSCKARAIVRRTKDEDGTVKDTLAFASTEHSHPAETAEITAESLKLEMAEIAKKDPAKPMSAAIKTVRERAEERYGDGEGFFEEVLDALGGDDAIARRLIDVRAKIIGLTPKNGNQF